jgi:aldehyde dehydrogenase (NAD+)
MGESFKKEGQVIPGILEKQRRFFETGETLSLSFRKEQLCKIRDLIKANESLLYSALKSDLGKSEAETFIGEIAFCRDEIAFALKHLSSWMRPKRVPTPWVQWVGRSEIRYEPLGSVLILSPWNYPFQLLVSPLIGALAAGNCAVLKPSELAPATSRAIRDIFQGFSEEVVAVVEGDAKVAKTLLQERWGHVFFTGGTEVGRQVMMDAAKTLSPVTLELGGKSPCIVDKSTDMDVTARRIAWGKFFNAGQTCVAPDYLLVPKGMGPEIGRRIYEEVKGFFGKDARTSPDYGRIVNDRHFQRLQKYLGDGKIEWGGESDPKTRYLAPTLMTETSWEKPVLQEEIFGPILPVLEYDVFDDAIAMVRMRSKPLALYLFSNDSNHQERVLQELSFGGGCVNDTLVHLANPHLPFGGVGDSGIGAYHGRFSFETFSHRKSVLRRSFFPDLKLRYPPYNLNLLRKILR